MIHEEIIKFAGSSNKFETEEEYIIFAISELQKTIFCKYKIYKHYENCLDYIQEEIDKTKWYKKIIFKPMLYIANTKLSYKFSKEKEKILAINKIIFYATLYIDKDDKDYKNIECIKKCNKLMKNV